MPYGLTIPASIVAILLSYIPAGYAMEFTYATVDVPGALVTSLTGINNAGQIVGGTQAPSQAFVGSGGTFTPLSFSDGTSISAFDINNNGHVVGSYFDGTNPSQGFRYDGTTYTSINSTDGRFLSASGINDTNYVVGTFETTVGTFNPQQGFLLHPDGTFSVLSVPDSIFTDARGINNAGQIVGRFRDGGFAERGFLYSGGIYTPIAIPGALWTNATGINSVGDIVGSFHDGTAEHGFHYSNNVFSIIDPESSVLTNAWGINDTGHIVGTFYSPTGGYHGFVAAPVPLPAAVLLFVTGLGFVSLALKRRRVA